MQFSKNVIQAWWRINHESKKIHSQDRELRGIAKLFDIDQTEGH